MRTLLLLIALIGLVLTLVPSFFVFSGHMAWNLHSQLMFVGMILWFVFAPIGMKRKKSG